MLAEHVNAILATEEISARLPVTQTARTALALQAISVLLVEQERLSVMAPALALLELLEMRQESVQQAVTHYVRLVLQPALPVLGMLN